MNFRDVNARFLALEAELTLFERTVDEVHFWERVRFGVHRHLRRELGLIGQAHTKSPHSRAEVFYRLCKHLIVRSPFLAPAGDVLVWGHERRKRQDDGTWWDIYCDPVISALDTDFVYLEGSYEGEHLTPARTSGVRYLDFIESAPGVALKAGSSDILLSDREVASLERLSRRFEREFGVEVDLADRVGRTLVRRRVQLPLYGRVLARVDPEVALLVVSYGRETFIEACQERAIPVVELQHGVVSEHHFGYSYPGDRSKRAFPDYFLSFGEFWEDAVELPLADDRIYPVGYPYLETKVERYGGGSDGEQVVFLSQGTIGPDLSRFAVEFAERSDREVVYKLHPGEYSRWCREYPWLIDADLDVVDSHEPELYELLAESAAQVGVYSTALYEGQCFDVETYVVDLQGAAYMDRLIEMGAATLVHDVDGLLQELSGDTQGPTPDTERFFRPDSRANVRQALASIRGRERE